MSDEIREHISAMMDDELETGSRFVVHAITDNPEHRSLWQRYHLIGDAMRGMLPGHIDLSLADRISSAIAREPALGAPKSQVTPTLRKPAVGFAIAASVAVIVILGVRQVSEVPGGGPSAVPVQTQTLASSQPDNMQQNQSTAIPSTVPAQTPALASSQLDSILRNQIKVVPVTTTVGVNPEVQAYTPPVDAETRLNRYLLNYNEYRTNTGVQGMLPYVRIVTHEVDQ